jgi:hypothetical protein
LICSLRWDFGSWLSLLQIKEDDDEEVEELLQTQLGFFAAFVFERDDDYIILGLEEINVNYEFNLQTNQKGISTLLIHQYVSINSIFTKSMEKKC